MTPRRDSSLKDWAEWMLFFSSYFPLYLILAAKTISVSYDFGIFRTPMLLFLEHEVSSLSLFFVGFGLLTAAFFITIIYFKRSENGQPKPIQETSEKNEIVITYILVHVFPFAFIDYSSELNMMAFVFFFLSLGVIQVRSRYLYINPILSFL